MGVPRGRSGLFFRNHDLAVPQDVRFARFLGILWLRIVVPFKPVKLFTLSRQSESDSPAQLCLFFVAPSHSENMAHHSPMAGRSLAFFFARCPQEKKTHVSAVLIGSLEPCDGTLCPVIWELIPVLQWTPSSRDHPRETFCFFSFRWVSQSRYSASKSTHSTRPTPKKGSSKCPGLWGSRAPCIHVTCISPSTIYMIPFHQEKLPSKRMSSRHQMVGVCVCVSVVGV